MTSLHAINHFSLAKLVPLDTPISVTDLATLVPPLHEHDIRRIIRYTTASSVSRHRAPCGVAGGAGRER